MYDWALANGKIMDEEAYLLSLGDASALRVNLTKMNTEEFVGKVDSYKASATV